MSISKPTRVTASNISKHNAEATNQKETNQPEEFESTETLKTAHTITFPEWFVFLNGCLPLIQLAYDGRYHRLGPDPIENALHTTGMLAVLSLVGTLSVTPLRKITGFDKLFYFRRPLGLLSFLYAILHAGIFVAHDRAGDFNDAWNEICQRRYLQLGAVALLLLVPLVITSTPRMLKLLGFRRWKLLHRLVYVSAALAIIHQYLQIRADATKPIVLGTVLVGLLSYRVVSRYNLIRKRNERDQQNFDLRCDGKPLPNVSSEKTILQAAEAAGIDLPSDCRSGVCGACRVRLVHGSVEMLITDGLRPSDQETSIILACQATCRSDVEIEILDSPSDS